MKLSVENIEYFFKVDLEIKKILNKSDIQFDLNYDKEYLSLYADKLYNRNKDNKGE